MVYQFDFQTGIGLETTYGTPVTPTRFYETPVNFDYTPVKVQGVGARPNRRAPRLDRNVLARIEASGTTEMDVPTAGFGFLLRAVFGSSPLTGTITGTTPQLYQHLFTLSSTSSLDSYTIQGVVPTLGDLSLAQTFPGCVASSLELTANEGEIVKATIEWQGRNMVTDQEAAVASFPTASVFTFAQGVIGIRDGATLGSGTTSLMSLTGGTEVAASAVRSFNIKIDNGLDTAGYTLGGGGERTRRNQIGERKITGQVTVELTDATLRDAYMQQKPLRMLLTFTNGQSVLQVAVNQLLLQGGVPKSNAGDVITIDAPFEAFDGAGAPVQIVYRSTDQTP
jgi:hypothetical protein